MVYSDLTGASFRLVCTAVEDQQDLVLFVCDALLRREGLEA